MNGNFLTDISETPIRNLDCVAIEDGVKRVATGDSLIEDTEEPGADVGGHTAIPGRIEPKSSFLSVSVLLGSSISIINCMDVYFFIFEIVLITTRI